MSLSLLLFPEGDAQKPTRAIAILQQQLNGPDPQVRAEAVLALGRLGGKTAIAALVKALMDEDAQVRRAIVKTLGAIGDTQVIPVLCQMIEFDPDPDVRCEAVSVLGHLGQPGSNHNETSQPTSEQRSKILEMSQALRQLLRQLDPTQSTQTELKCRVAQILQQQPALKQDFREVFNQETVELIEAVLQHPLANAVISAIQEEIA